MNTNEPQYAKSNFWVLAKRPNSLSTYIFEVSAEFSDRVHQGHGVTWEAFLSWLFCPWTSTCLCLQVSDLILQLHKNLKIHVYEW